jgi:hypothetical protein
MQSADYPSIGLTSAVVRLDGFTFDRSRPDVEREPCLAGDRSERARISGEQLQHDGHHEISAESAARHLSPQPQTVEARILSPIEC